MSACIFNRENVYIVKRYKTLAAAKGALSRAVKTGRMVRQTSFGKGRYKAEEIAKLEVGTVDYFNEHVDYETTTKNLMSGKEVKIRMSDKGGCTDPGTERYWSM